jgi:hypothetical protein
VRNHCAELTCASLRLQHASITPRYLPKVNEALLATGLFKSRANPDADPRRNRKRTDKELEVLNAEALEFFSGCPWFIDQVHQSYHPLPQIRELVLHVLMEGMKLNPKRFSVFWEPVFGVVKPCECDKGFAASRFAPDCMNCGMPPQYCASVARLQAELNDWAKAGEGDERSEVVDMPLRDLTAVALFMIRRNGDINPPPSPVAIAAIEDFVRSGLTTDHFQKCHFHGQFLVPRRVGIPSKAGRAQRVGEKRVGATELAVGPALWAPEIHHLWPVAYRDAVLTVLVAEHTRTTGARASILPDGEEAKKVPPLPPQVWFEIFSFLNWYAFS